MKDLEALKKHILNKVKLSDLLVAENLINGAGEEEQLSCPFHGVDVKKSARYYSDSDTIYCWVCRKAWDLFAYISQQNGLSFKESLSHIITTYRIDISSVPEMIDVLGTDKIKIKQQHTNNKERYLLQLKETLFKLRDKIDKVKHAKLVYSYMIMKNSVPNEKFVEYVEKMNSALVRVMEKNK